MPAKKNGEECMFVGMEVCCNNLSTAFRRHLREILMYDNMNKCQQKAIPNENPEFRMRVSNFSIPCWMPGLHSIVRSAGHLTIEYIPEFCEDGLKIPVKWAVALGKICKQLGWWKQISVRFVQMCGLLADADFKLWTKRKNLMSGPSTQHSRTTLIATS